MDATEPITDEVDFIRRREVVARLAWLRHRLATATHDANDANDEDTTDDGTDGEEAVEDLDECQRRADEACEYARLRRFLVACDTVVGQPEWEAVNDADWAGYAADVAADLFGDAVLQDAWSDEVWALEYAKSWHAVALGTATFHVTA